MIKRPESQVLIRFPDCDPFNHLNNSRYIDYFINAREDHLMKYYQFSPYELVKSHGVSWVVTQNQIAYLRPAMMMEPVTIQTRVLRFRPKDILVEMTMWDANKQSLKAVLWTTFTHINFKTGKSEIHSQELTERFQKLEDPLPGDIPFEERVRAIKNNGYE
ncbi:MAG: acyl-CoA thioesterase [Flammeovirgaceae bacterium]|nr:acyl-CoA thioesterase [Flammeovirgaceae bacterium]